ncbi:MAG: ABC transporter substrate-binding protein, partial [Candidatus Hydrothermarchaeaceae archaeon]
MRVKRGYLKSLYGVLVSVILALLLQTALVQTVYAAKVKVATALGRHPVFVMPMLAIEDNGLWKQVGVDAEWVSFRSGTSMNQAAAAGSIQLGVTDSTTVVRSIARGLPALIVYYMGPIADWGIWVLTDSKLKKASDLKNKSITVTRLGSSPHAYSQLVAKAEGMAGAIKYVGTGGVREDVASLLSGAVASSMLTIFVVAPLIDKGRVRRLLSVSDYLP